MSEFISILERLRAKDPKRLKSLNAAAKEFGYKNFNSLPKVKRTPGVFDIRQKVVQRATARQAGVLPISEANIGKQFDPSLYTNKMGYSISELDKATKYYTKGKINKFKELVGPESKIIRKTISENLKRNKGKFRDPAISVKDQYTKQYDDIKKFVDDFKAKNKRLPSGREIARGTGYAEQGAIEAAKKKGIIETYKGIPPEAAKAGAAKRAEIQKAKAEAKNKTPIVRKSGPGGKVEKIVYPKKTIDGKSYKEAYLKDLKLRRKFGRGNLKAKKAAGVLSDAQMVKKYGFSSPTNFASNAVEVSKFEKLPQVSVKSSEQFLQAQREATKLLQDIQGRRKLPPGLHGTQASKTALQHALQKDPKLPITADNLVFVPAEANVKELKRIEGLRDKIVKQRDLLLKNKPSGYVKKVNALNTKGIDLAAKSDGLVQFQSIDAKGKKFTYKVGSEKYSLDPIGLNENKLLKDYTPKDYDLLRLNVDEARRRGSKIKTKKIIKRFSTDLPTDIRKVKNFAKSKGFRLNSFAGVIDLSQAGLKIPPSILRSMDNILSAGGKVARGAGKAAMIIDPIFAAMDFSKAMGEGLSGGQAATYTVGKFGQDILNLPRTIEDIAYLATEEGTLKNFGQKKDRLLGDAFKAEFADRYLQEKRESTPEATKDYRKAKIDYAKTLPIIDDMEIPMSQSEAQERERAFYLQRGVEPPEEETDFTYDGIMSIVSPKGVI